MRAVVALPAGVAAFICELNSWLPSLRAFVIKYRRSQLLPLLKLGRPDRDRRPDRDPARTSDGGWGSWPALL
jgi:hypothetical protein